MDAEIEAEFGAITKRLDGMDDRFERLMRGIAEQFEVQRKYMDRRFNELLEALDVRQGNHERRIRRLEDRVFGTE